MTTMLMIMANMITRLTITTGMAMASAVVVEMPASTLAFVSLKSESNDGFWWLLAF